MDFARRPARSLMRWVGARISRSIIESHNGRLWAVASPGRGATSHLSLPAVQHIPQAPTHTASPRVGPIPDPPATARPGRPA
jgi:hypothetical protein